mmetsp:Transcript_10687/g.17243  ORF Transcript_10687/g.17243 Transcript_10687/m.17243 type:complete len:80 (-) Transcript_10687:388-627(-)
MTSSMKPFWSYSNLPIKTRWETAVGFTASNSNSIALNNIGTIVIHYHNPTRSVKLTYMTAYLPNGSICWIWKLRPTILQ